MSIPLTRAGEPIQWGHVWEPTGGDLTWRPIVPHPDRPVIFAKDIALVTCNQGHESVLSAETHSVSFEGQVSPSYVCPIEGCAFHHYVTLEGWEKP
jgi:hypothetical protein